MTSSISAVGVSQNEMLFMRGKAISGAPIISGTNQLPKPPISAGIAMKNTMIRPCAVTKVLKVCGIGEILHPRLLELEAHHDRQETTHDAAHDGGDEVHRADVLVVGRKDVAPPAGRVVVVGVAVSCCRSHDKLSLEFQM
jgi:hypothetical protein